MNEQRQRARQSHRFAGDEKKSGEGGDWIVVSEDERVAYVNNTASHDISVIEMKTRRVIARIPVAPRHIRKKTFCRVAAS